MSCSIYWGKGRRAFEMKEQTLEIEPTHAMVKADRALTLFMINTLAENARKYTPEGGVIQGVCTYYGFLCGDFCRR